MIREFIRGAMPASVRAHEQQQQLWQAQVQLGLGITHGYNSQGQIVEDPMVTSIYDLLQSNNLTFLRGSGKLILNQALQSSTPGQTYVMPTISEEAFRKLKGIPQDPANEARKDPHGFFEANRKRQVGAICLKPYEVYLPLDRSATLAHELTHAINAKLPLIDEDWPIEVRNKILQLSATAYGMVGFPKEWSPRKLRTVDEIEAYRVTGMVLDSGTDLSLSVGVGDFVDYVSEDWSRLDNLSFPNTPSIRNLASKTVLGGSTVLALGVCQLFEQGTMAEDSVLNILEANGII